MKGYRVVTAKSSHKLAEEVQYCLSIGWKPQGGVCVASEPLSSFKFFQAMVRDYNVCKQKT